MMHQADYAQFKRLINRLGETLGKPVTDELLESWWKALRSSEFREIEAAVDRYLARADENTRFPRPAQFRPKSDRPPNDAATGNPTRDYWRSMIVHTLQRMLCIEHRITTAEGLEAWLPQTKDNAPYFGTSLRGLLDELCDLETRNQGQRTQGLYELCTKRTRHAASVLLRERGIAV
jgi:hypothetical protein